MWGDAQDQLFARIDGNGAGWYLTDRLGSVRDELNASGVSQDHTDYTAFGVIISQSSASAQGRFAFTSKDFDAQTGLQYNLARYYSPAAGTWTSEDPTGYDAGDVNLYRYVGNDASNNIDPKGLQGVSLVPLVIKNDDFAVSKDVSFYKIEHRVTFEPKDGAKGWFMQHVIREFMVTTSTPPFLGVGKTDDFWEIFPINQIGIPGVKKTFPDVVDSFAYAAKPHTAGKIRFYGQSYFLVGWDPPGGVWKDKTQPEHVPGTGDMLTSTTTPPVWAAALRSGQSPMERDLIFTWDDHVFSCPGWLSFDVATTKTPKGWHGSMTQD